MNDITVKELKERMDAGTAPRIIDVREPHEWEMGHITDELFPMASVPVRIDELKNSQDAELVVHCRSGGRSGQIAMYLRQQGFQNVRNLLGGMLAWKEEVDPSFNVQ